MAQMTAAASGRSESRQVMDPDCLTEGILKGRDLGFGAGFFVFWLVRVVDDGSQAHADVMPLRHALHALHPAELHGLNSGPSSGQPLFCTSRVIILGIVEHREREFTVKASAIPSLNKQVAAHPRHDAYLDLPGAEAMLNYGHDNNTSYYRVAVITYLWGREAWTSAEQSPRRP